MEALNEQELRRYLQRVGDRWPLERAVLGGARVPTPAAPAPSASAGPSTCSCSSPSAFDGVPWLERVYQAASLWDASEMGDAADVHCYTPAELERKVETLRRVRDAVETGYDLLAAPAA